MDMQTTKAHVSLDDVTQAHKRISDCIHYTPVLTSSQFDEKYGRRFYFKAENFQKTGSFKVRGALNAVTILKDCEENVNGVATHTSGNHGQALAWSARRVGISCHVVTPRDTPEVKIQAIQSYGANVTLCDPSPVARAEECAKICREKGYQYIPSSDHYDIMAGQGTIALEFLDQVPILDAIIVPTSAGGMLAGIASAAKAIKPNIKVFAVEPLGKDLEPSLRSGQRLWPNPPQCVDTIADGIRTQQLGHLTWPIILELVEKDVFTVSNSEVAVGMRFAFERMKVVIESASGAAVGAAMSKKMQQLDPSIKHVGLILCGGNVSFDKFPWK